MFVRTCSPNMFGVNFLTQIYEYSAKSKNYRLITDELKIIYPTNGPINQLINQPIIKNRISINRLMKSVATQLNSLNEFNSYYW